MIEWCGEKEERRKDGLESQGDQDIADTVIETDSITWRELWPEETLGGV